MVVNFARCVGDTIVQERIEGDLLFEGGDAQQGVLVTFRHGGREITGRVVSVGAAPPEDDPEAGLVIEVEAIDNETQDLGGEVARINLPPDDDTGTKI
ncbi:MAG: hypothetical protein JO032_13295 [Alphaproteobacteria bacterium]|nr:hypothetical protein [Alphaproteobacteria bacterium]MBV9553751.1 hypothetical protein [Alphaproteobacteria bacterium]